jgi:uncharacterized damage-inducible protein DinB
LVSELTLIREWFRYNDEVRARYLAALAEVPPEELIRDREASFPLLDIFLHVLDAQRAWVSWVATDRVKEWEESVPRVRLRARVRTIPETWQAMREVGGEVATFLASLSETDLLRRLEYDDRTPGGDLIRAHILVRDLLWHLVEEELQHRGEMNALLWQLGREPPILDWVDWRNAGMSP